MKRWAVAGLVIVFVISLAVASYASPYWTMHQLRAAAEAGDPEALQQYVDFPALRESIKAEIQEHVVGQALADQKPEDNPFAGLGTMIANAMLGPMVDAMITPAGIAAMTRGKPDSKAAAATSQPTQPPATSGSKKDAGHARYEYDGLNRVLVKFESEGSTEKSPALVFRREGPFSWKLAQLILPPMK